MVFNNGAARPDGEYSMVEEYSTVEEIVLPINDNGFYAQPTTELAFLPVSQEWIYSGMIENPFFSRNISGAHRLENGNTLICIGSTGHFVEVTPKFDVVREYIIPISNSGALNQGDPPPMNHNSTFRCHKYDPDFGVLHENELFPRGYLELNPIMFYGTMHFPINPTSQDTIIITSKVTAESGISLVYLNLVTESETLSIQMFDDGLIEDEIAEDSIFTATITPQEEQTVVSYFLYADNNSSVSFNDPPFASEIYSFHFNVSSADTSNQMQDLSIEVDNDTIILTWSNVLNAISYNIYKSEFPDGNFVIVDTVTNTTWSEPNTNSQNFYRVTSSNNH